MLSNHLLLKLILAPLIIAAATLVARRWGENIGGLLIGLPLTSGPVSLFFALEQGQGFAAAAARGAMLGLIPVVVFCAGYSISARRLPWQLSAFSGISMYLLSVWGVSLAAPGLGWIVLLVSAALLAGLWVVQVREEQVHKILPPWWDLPVRVAIATLLLLLITGGAGGLGSKWGGLLSPFPVFTFVMTTFSHSQGGPGAALRLMRGVLSGLFAYLAFFLVIALLVEQANLAVTYLLATCAALGVNGLSLAGLVSRRQADSGEDDLG